MKLGMIGLGRMGGNMVVRLLRHGHEVVAFARTEASRAKAASMGADAAPSLAALVERLPSPRVAWTMVPAGDTTESVVGELSGLLEAGDVIVDGGNSNFRDTKRRAAELEERGIHLLDCGTSGEREAVRIVEPAFLALAPEGGYAHVGPSGSGHFTKMVHNGIEYGMLEAFGEGFEILERSEFDLDLESVAGIWRYGSVVRSWLLELLHDALERDPRLERVRGYVEDSGEGRWTVQAAIDQGVPAYVIASSLFARFASRRDESFSAKVIAALRREFGGHAVKGT